MEFGTDATSNAAVERSALRLARGRRAPTASRSNSNSLRARLGHRDVDGGAH